MSSKKNSNQHSSINFYLTEKKTIFNIHKIADNPKKHQHRDIIESVDRDHHQIHKKIRILRF